MDEELQEQAVPFLIYDQNTRGKQYSNYVIE